MKILFLEVDEQDAALIRSAFPDADIRNEALDSDALIAACSGYDVVSTFIYSKFSRDVLLKLPNLRLLCTRSVGFNHIDLATCAERGVTVCNVPDYGSHVIAEHVFALLLGTMRHVHEADEKVKQGHFDYHGLRGMALLGKTIGIVGTGKIGSRVARIAKGFGMRVLAVDQCRDVALEKDGVAYVTLQELLHESDIVTLHVPALPDTMHMMNEQTFARMKNGAILVNTARGELIDSPALLKALQAGKVQYALLDVLEHEKDFTWNEELLSHPRVVVTPHIAFYADDSVRSMYNDCFASINTWLKGHVPLHVVEQKAMICDLPPLKNSVKPS
jgi:D-lactate dehydrogenase